MLLKIFKIISWVSLILADNTYIGLCKEKCDIGTYNFYFPGQDTAYLLPYATTGECFNPISITIPLNKLGINNFADIDVVFQDSSNVSCCRYTNEIGSENSFYFWCPESNKIDNIVFQFVDRQIIDSSRKIKFKPVIKNRFPFPSQFITNSPVNTSILDMEVFFRNFIKSPPIELYIKNTGVRPLDRLFIGKEIEASARYIVSSVKSNFIFPTTYMDDGSWLVKIDIESATAFTKIVCWINDGDIVAKTTLKLNINIRKIEWSIPELFVHTYRDNLCIKSDLIIPIFPSKNLISTSLNYDVIIVGSGFLANIIANSFSKDNQILVIDPGNGYEDVNVSTYINVKDSGVQGDEIWHVEGRSLIFPVAQEINQNYEDLFPQDDISYLKNEGYKKAKDFLNVDEITQEQQNILKKFNGGTILPRINYNKTKISLGSNVHKITNRLVNRILDKNTIQVADMSNDGAFTIYKSPIIYLASGTIGNIRILSSNQKLFNQSGDLGTGVKYLRETKFDPYIFDNCDGCVNVTIEIAWSDMSLRMDLELLSTGSTVLSASFYTPSRTDGQIWHSAPLHKPALFIQQTDDEHDLTNIGKSYSEICQILSGKACDVPAPKHKYIPFASELTGGAVGIQNINVMGRSSLSMPLWDRTLVTVALALRSPKSFVNKKSLPIVVKNECIQEKKNIEYVDHSCVPGNMISANLSNTNIEKGQAYASTTLVTPFSAIGVGARSNGDDQTYDGTGVRVIIQEGNIYHWSHYDLPVPNLIHLDDIYHDYSEHATNTAGILFSKQNNFGTTGIAHKATPYYLKPDQLIDSMSFFRYGDVLTNSFGISQKTSWEVNTSTSANVVIVDLVPYIKELVKRGVRIFSSAGNGNCNMDIAQKTCDDSIDKNCQEYSRSMDTGTFIVASMDPITTKRRFDSNCGSRVDLISWGFNVTTTTNTRNGYTYDYGGTSSATPISAASGALVQQFLNQKNLIVSSLAFRSVIVQTGTTFNENTYRQINIENAIEKFKEYAIKDLPVANNTKCDYNMRVLNFSDFIDTNLSIFALYKGDKLVDNTFEQWNELKCFDATKGNKNCISIPCGNRFIYETKEDLKIVVQLHTTYSKVPVIYDYYTPDNEQNICNSYLPTNGFWCI